MMDAYYPTRKEQLMTSDEWNARYPVGTRVDLLGRFQSGPHVHEILETRTQTPARTLDEAEVVEVLGRRYPPGAPGVVVVKVRGREYPIGNRDPRAYQVSPCVQSPQGWSLPLDGRRVGEEGRGL